jgi:hypothetical protein
VIVVRVVEVPIGPDLTANTVTKMARCGRNEGYAHGVQMGILAFIRR